MAQDYYQILGIDRGASMEQVKASYRALAKETHPDLNPGDSEAEAKFKEISEAYEVLSDPERRKEYDNPNPFGGGFGPFSFGGSPFEFFNTFSFTLHRPPPPPVPKHGEMRGKNHEIEVVVTPFSLLLEHELKFQYNRMVKCEVCEGKGADLSHCPTCQGYGIRREEKIAGRQKRVYESPCGDCGQTGLKRENVCAKCEGTGVTFQLATVTANLKSEHGVGSIQLNGAGHFGPHGGPPGDVIVRLKIVYPTNSHIPAEAKQKIAEAYEQIYKKS